jgi:hypothetical protein
MNCRECRAASVEFARTGDPLSPDVERHLAACAACALFFESQRNLSIAFAELAREPAASVPQELEAQVLSAFDRANRARWWPAAAALAASLIGGLMLLRAPAPQPRAAQPFIEIPYVAPLAPYERTEILRMEVPVAALIAAGFKVHAVDTGAVLQADVLFGQDRRAHAIRLVSPPERIFFQ